MNEYDTESLSSTCSDVTMEDILFNETQDHDNDSGNTDSISESLVISEFFTNISDKDLFDLDETIYETIEQYIHSEIIHCSKPTFMKTMETEIMHLIFQTLLSSNICEDSHYDEIYDYVKELISIYIEFIDLPPRSNDYVTQSDIDKTQLQNIIHKLQESYQPQQKTPEWYKYRYNLITASNIWKTMASDAQKNSIIYEKCKPLDMSTSDYGRTNTNSTLHWGNKYEPLTIAIYEKLYATKVGEFGCIRHPIYPWIGASPDGINIDPNSKRFGRMIEVKNIVNREITGIPFEAYWIQTQIQMETCGLDRCDFMETRFCEYKTADEFYNDNSHEFRGILLYFIHRENMENSPVYKFMPLDVPIEKSEINKWIENTKKTHYNELVLFETIYWYLDEYSCIEIQYNKLWITAAMPQIEKIWKIIEEERISGYEHRAPKKRKQSSEVIEMNYDTNTYTIHNMPTTKGICVIKLDENENNNDNHSEN